MSIGNTEAPASPLREATKLRMNQAIGAAMADEMREDDTVVVFGEDVAQSGGVFKTSVGLLDEFGPSRVRDTPISEMAIAGAAVGAAAAGLRPVIEIMFAEFYGVALDQIVTQAAKLHYLSNGALTIPLVSRGSCGAGRGFGATHSQTLETWFLATPGLKLAVCSGAQSAYGLLRSAIRDDNPVVFLEPKALYGEREEVVTGDEGIIPLGVAATKRAGDDVTLVTLGQMVGVSLRAAAALESRVSVEVIDLQTLLPWDHAAVLASVARTRRLVVVEENPFTGGWGTEIVAHVASQLHGQLDAPPHRVTTPDVPVPFNRTLEFTYLPSAEYVAEQVAHLVEHGILPAPWWEVYA
ncbi:Pyruvate/2-oxoglutarate dehydrogenase complex dehydrogenase (E1) component [Gaiella occulta]|uniref:Pyruvate/2-oxoglutarate dehydrogenase complex dehydrogenase (E1) component n=1 Tax=Gaiella occulta TaxID=1002870 RepID=A0A7M2YW73_9ACTN|nr:pyruvate dehydrogenase complex E1 component subunit beta [Gaiella occulta]RDI74392.1 Pyruvate/2-oxoglutarate dehydrogenase complex dehydrogenase (E1) component [Gaiella occulta]